MCQVNCKAVNAEEVVMAWSSVCCRDSMIHELPNSNQQRMALKGTTNLYSGQ